MRFEIGVVMDGFRLYFLIYIGPFIFQSVSKNTTRLRTEKHKAFQWFKVPPHIVNKYVFIAVFAFIFFLLYNRRTKDGSPTAY